MTRWMLRARWCAVRRWPIPHYYARCPQCQLVVEERLHPSWEWEDAARPNIVVHADHRVIDAAEVAALEA